MIKNLHVILSSRYITTRGIQTNAEFILWTKIDVCVMHFVNFCIKFYQKLVALVTSWFLAIFVIFYQILAILFSKNTSHWFWLTKFAYRSKNLQKISSQFNATVFQKWTPAKALKLRGRQSHEFAIFDKILCSDLLNALYRSLF